MVEFLTITIEGKISSEEAEKLEDKLARILGALGWKGHLYDNVTGNTTAFPHLKTDDDYSESVDCSKSPNGYHYFVCKHCGLH